ncbi:uncharacterized protein METZ01_LOCUS423969, partial [marine metagenome]
RAVGNPRRQTRRGRRLVGGEGVSANSGWRL